MKLNLASGTDIKDPPWLNLDIVPKWPVARRGCDVILDAHNPIPFPDCSADEVKAGYLFLHMPPRRHPGLLAEIFRVLQPGGLLMVDETNMEEVLPRWLKDPTNRSLAECIWGEMGDSATGGGHGFEFEEYDKHKQGFTEASLRKFLGDGGFVDITRIRYHAPAVWWDLTMTCKRP